SGSSMRRDGPPSARSTPGSPGPSKESRFPRPDPCRNDGDVSRTALHPHFTLAHVLSTADGIRATGVAMAARGRPRVCAEAGAIARQVRGAARLLDHAGWRALTPGTEPHATWAASRAASTVGHVVTAKDGR